MAGRLYLFAGGGTGGHLFPGIAVAEALLEQEPDARILFSGSDRPIERDILSATPFEHRVLPAVGLSGAMRHPLRFVGRTLDARRESARLVDDNKPAVVIGCGGFASAAPVYAASRRAIPFILLEQNAIPGRATRWLSRLGGTVCLSFVETRQHLPRSAVSIVTGNPVRRAIADLARRLPSPTGRTLLVLGGSQGSDSINCLLRECLTRSRDLLQSWKLFHQTGTGGAGQTTEQYKQLKIDAEVAPFFDDLPARYQSASLVVSRAGATTLAELACAGIPALLVPYPHAADDHQRYNAAVYEQAGAAVQIDNRTQQATDGRPFADVLRELLHDGDRRLTMAAAMSGLARPDAAARVCDIVRELAAR